MVKYFDERMKRIDVWDVVMIKFSVVAFVLFVIAIWPATMEWVLSVNPWAFLVVFVIFVARPFYKFYLKK